MLTTPVVLAASGSVASATIRTNYANGLAGSLITSAVAVTPEKRDSAIAAAKAYLSKETTLERRRRELAGSNLPGVYISHRVGHLKPQYICTLGQVSGADGTTVTRFVSQGINDSSNLQPESAPTDIVGNVVFLVEESATPLPDLWSSNAGAPFTKDDLSSLPDLQRPIPDDTATYRIVVAPRSMPILFGHDTSCRGEIDDTTVSLLDQALPGSGLWAQWVSEWRHDIQEAILAATTPRNKLGRKMPSVKASCKPFASSALVLTETLYADDRSAQPALDGLRKRLFEAVPPPPRPAPMSEVAAPQPPEQPIPAQQAAPAGARPAGTLGTIPKRATFTSYTEEEALAARYQLGNVAFDPETGAIGVPALLDDAEYMFFSLTTGRKRNDHLEDILRTYSEACDNELDFLRRLFDPPRLDQGGKAIVVNTLPSTTPMTELESLKNRFRPHLLAPDNAATLRARDEAGDDRDLEEMCGQDTANLTKVNIAIVSNTNVLGKDAFMGMLANRTGLVEATVKVNKEQWDDVANPLIYKFCREMAMNLTTKAARQWLKATHSASVRRFFGWLLQMWDSYECFLGTVPVASRNQLYVLTGELSKIPLDGITKAEMLKVEVMSNVLKIIHGTLRVPDSTLITHLEDKEARKRAADAAKAARPEKTIKTEKHNDNIDRSGCIICKKKGTMPFPPGEGTTNRICAGFVRVGAHCRQGNSCPNIHSLTPESWPAEALKIWVPHVDSHPELSWTSTVRVDAVKAALEKVTAPAEGK